MRPRYFLGGLNEATGAVRGRAWEGPPPMSWTPPVGQERGPAGRVASHKVMLAQDGCLAILQLL